MVDVARRQLPAEVLFDAICETRNCLPDAIQLLTPCTIGNGWLKVVNVGRFALTLYDKYQGEGVRVFLDPAKVADWPEINAWYLKLKPKKEQDSDRLLEEIRKAGPEILGWQRVQIRPQFLGKRHRGAHSHLPPVPGSLSGPGWRHLSRLPGRAPLSDRRIARKRPGPTARPCKSLPAEQAVGRRALHDMTMIVPGASKGPAFEKGQVIGVGDLCRLQQMGRQHLYVMEENQVGPEWVHEDEAALAFARALAGDGVTFTEPPREGKVNLLAARDGLLVVDEPRLESLQPGARSDVRLPPGVFAADPRPGSGGHPGHTPVPAPGRLS